MKKIVTTCFLIVFYYTGQAQFARPFVSVAADISDEFVNNGFINISTGVELKVLDFLHPQIEIGYSYGLLNENASRDSDFKINGISQAKFSVFNLGFTPKWLVYSDEEGWYSINVLPKYTFSQITAGISYANVDSNGDVVLPYNSQQALANRHSFGIGLGICVNFSQRNKNSMAFNLYFNNIEYGDALNKLNKLDRPIYTDNVVGFGLVYYFSLKKRFEKPNQ
jgi:hypothetical protein